jgi:hypothetical protein
MKNSVILATDKQICRISYISNNLILLSLFLILLLFWRMLSSGMWHRVDLVWTNVSEEHIASIFRVEGLIWFILLPWRWRQYVPPKRWFTQDPHGATSQKTAFFIVTEVKTSNLTFYCFISNKFIFIIVIVISIMYNLDAHNLYQCILISRMNKNEWITIIWTGNHINLP